MITRRRFGLPHVLVVFTKALLITLALIYLGEFAGMSFVREAEGALFYF